MLAVIVYHKNIFQIYEPEWIRVFKSTILNQTREDFVIYELNYGGAGERLFVSSVYESIEMPTFVHAMNYLIDKAFKDGATAIFNTNCDDTYSLERMSIQSFFIGKGYELVSSNFCLVKDGITIHTHAFDKLDIKIELERGHNVICHPVVAMSKSFWEKNGPYDPEAIPFEDLLMWQKGINNSCFIILPDVLHYQRIHGNSVCKSTNR